MGPIHLAAAAAGHWRVPKRAARRATERVLIWQHWQPRYEIRNSSRIQYLSRQLAICAFICLLTFIKLFVRSFVRSFIADSRYWKKARNARPWCNSNTLRQLLLHFSLSNKWPNPFGLSLRVWTNPTRFDEGGKKSAAAIDCVEES